MPTTRRSALLLAVLSLSACASFEERLAGWEQDSRAAGRPVLVYGADTTGSSLNLTLANTGSQAITGLTVTLEPYAAGKPFGPAGGHAFDLGSALPPAGITAGAPFTTRWDTGALGADCMRIGGLSLGFADGSSSVIGADKIDDYLAPVINKHCTVAPVSAPSSSYGSGKSY